MYCLLWQISYLQRFWTRSWTLIFLSIFYFASLVSLHLAFSLLQLFAVSFWFETSKKFHIIRFSATRFSLWFLLFCFELKTGSATWNCVPVTFYKPQKKGQIIVEIQTTVLRVFLLAIHSRVASTALRWYFYFSKLTQPLSVSIIHLLYTARKKECIFIIFTHLTTALILQQAHRVYCTDTFGRWFLPR